MRKREREAIGKLFETLTQAGDPGRAHGDLLAALMELSGAENGQFIPCRETVLGKRFSESIHGQQRYTEHYPKASPYYIWKNPIWPHIPKLKDTLIHIPSVVGERAWYNSEYYVDLLHGVGVRNCIGICLRNRLGEMAWSVGLAKDERRLAFPKKTRDFLAFLAPYVGRGLENLESWHERWQQANAVSTLLDAVSEAVAAVRDGQLLLASPSAARILGLHGQPPARNLCLQEFLRVAPNACGANGGRVNWTARDGRVYRLGSLNARNARDGHTLLVRLESLQPAAADPEADIRRAQARGLTHREARVFAALARGLSTKQIALDQGIAYDTARAHLRNLYRKLNASGRVEALNAVRGS
ncbi:MAG: helix-turn-helix transcriptional regulator [Planctomycetes bacterium]|nr:helix-turn-helix transcriptional regulator [Planctomycetota bacterium]